MTYHAIGSQLEEKASNNRTKDLGNPVKEASEEGDVSSNGQSKGDSWIQVSAWNIGCHGDPNK